MPMDTLYWNNLNSEIKFKTTRKQFFGRYLWRMEIHANCVNVALYDDPEHAVEVMKYRAQNSNNWGGSWRDPYWHFDKEKYNNVDFALFERIKYIKATFTKIKTRVEESSLQYYAETEDELKQIAIELGKNSCIQYITGPRAGTEQLLLSDAIFSPKVSYRYKILIRDGNYNLALKEQVLNLLEAQEDIKLTAGIRHGLKRPYPAIWGAFFYANDLSIVTMLNLMSPGIVGKIHEVVQA